jgi:predicted dehydrogenase
MKERRIRMGVVGAGIWGQMHIAAYSQHPSVDLAAICDCNEERVRDISKKYCVPKLYSDYEDMFLKENLDGISVATPDATHTNIVIKAAQRGIHVLVEKPLATTVAECESMLAAAAQNQVYLMIDWHNRWNPPYYHAWQSIRKGELGDIVYLYYRLSDTIYVPTKMLPWAHNSSVMLFLGSHALDTTCWLMQKKPKRIFCKRQSGVLAKLGIDIADLYVTLLDFEDGSTAVIENNWILPQSSPSLIDHKCEIIGTKGVIYIDPTHDRSLEKYTEKTPAGFPDTSLPDMFITPVIHGRQKGFAVESILHFADCVRDQQTPLTSGMDGLLNTKLIQAAEKSAVVGMPISIDD